MSKEKLLKRYKSKRAKKGDVCFIGHKICYRGAIFLLISIINTLFIATVTAAELLKTIDKETQLEAWKFSDGNFQLELKQRSPEQTRSFFQGRGFSPQVANDIATSCVFQTIGRNIEADNSVDSVSISLEDWRLIELEDKDKKEKSLKLKEAWNSEWKAGSVSTPARIAFRWATFPTEQSFDPGGDFNWGMISFGPKPSTRFDLHIFWKQGEQTHDAWIRQMQCPLDQTD